MNCISGSTLWVFICTLPACTAPASETDDAASSHDYGIHYTVTPQPDAGTLTLEMTLRQDKGQLRELSFRYDAASISRISADGQLDVRDGRITWNPATAGGYLRWQSTPSNRRNSKGYDALLNSHWGIFRAEDIIPRARSRTLKGARSQTTLSFELPVNWSAVSEYSTAGSLIEVNNPARRFDQPSGWIAMGELGIRRETIAGTRIAIVAPQGEAVRRMDMLALLNWTLPRLAEVIEDPIPRLTIVSAGDPMWRGGLSAPASIYIHAERPLISENATSTLMHEVVHVTFDISAAEGYDWIVEGLAEYYSLELLQRGAAITARRYQRALDKQSAWATEAQALCGPESTGATTALAVMTFRKLDVEIKQKSDGTHSLDTLVNQLTGRKNGVTLRSLQQAAAEVIGEPAQALQTDELPGCED